MTGRMEELLLTAVEMETQLNKCRQVLGSDLEDDGDSVSFVLPQSGLAEGKEPNLLSLSVYF